MPLISTLFAVRLGVQGLRSRRQSRAVAIFRELGGYVRTEPTAPLWLRRLVGDQFFVRSESMASLEDWWGGTFRVTDADLVHLKELTHLQVLHLRHSKITDNGLKHLKGLTKLHYLCLYHLQVTDDGLVHLKDLTRLQSLTLNYTQETNTGLEHLKSLAKLKNLYLNGLPVKDAALEHLKRLPKLQKVELYRTQVTDVGLADHRKTVPGLTVLYQE